MILRRIRLVYLLYKTAVNSKQPAHSKIPIFPKDFANLRTRDILLNKEKDFILPMVAGLNSKEIWHQFADQFTITVTVSHPVTFSF